jgi:hypothetical protein
MKKRRFEKLDRPHFGFAFERILLFTVALATCLAKATVGETTISSKVEAEQDLKLASSRRLTLEARAGYYLRAADIAVNTLRTGGADSRSREIYNEACAQFTAMLRSGDGARLWSRTETIASQGGIYRLRFAAGSRKDGTWDPDYFDFFRTLSQVHEKITH